MDPGTGALGSRHEWGIGRLAEPAELLAAVEAVVPAGGRPWDGLHVLVTAGGTREPIDSVRFVGNRSSGRMGFALAEEAAALGAEVTVIAANVALSRSPRVRYVDVEHRRRARRAPARRSSPQADVLLMAAAVADYRPAVAADTKLKKDEREELVVALERTPDVLSGLAAIRRADQTLVGFAAEHGDGAVAYGRDKLARKGLDAVVVNDIARDGHRLRGVRQRGHDRHRHRRAPCPARVEGRGRAGDPRGGRGPAQRGKDDGVSMDIEEEPGPVGEAEIASAQQLGRQVALAITDAVEVRRDLLDLVLVCVAAEGHILIEDLPGVGKTTLARAVARAFDLQFARVQCTADLLPADVVGTNVFNQREDRFEFRPGPIFANVVIVDEINRASPKTQSGLLECMQERRVTVDVHTHELARPFVVLATQNPIEFEGTYPLPEAQVDRFMARVSLGYPTSAGEVAMLARPRGRRPRRRARAGGHRRRAAGRPGRVAPRARLRRAARLRRLAAASHAPGPARRARRQPARRACCCCAPPRPAPCCRAATTRCPTTCRRWPRSCWPTASCSRPRRSTRAASRSSPTPWRRRRRCRRTPCARPPPPRSWGSCSRWSRRLSTPSRSTSPAWR